MDVLLRPVDDRTTSAVEAWPRRAEKPAVVDDRATRLLEAWPRQPWVAEVDARRVTLEAVLALTISTASLSGGTVGDVDSATVDLTWSAAVASLSSDYTLGLSVTVSGAPVAILAAQLLAGSQTVRLTLASAVDVDDTVAVAYDSGAGDLVDGSGLAVSSASTATENTVGSHYYFDEAADAVHVVTSL